MGFGFIDNEFSKYPYYLLHLGFGMSLTLLYNGYLSVWSSDRMNSQPSALSSTEPRAASRPNLCTAPLSPTEQHILNHTLFNPLLTDQYNKLQIISGIVLLHCIYNTGYN